MNLPTKITVFRIILAPVFIIIYMLPEQTGSFMGLSVAIMLPLFVLMEISDALDGHIARKYNMVTDLGKILDPFSDVISRVTFFICFTFTGIMPLWAFVIIIYRELGITFLRMMMMGKGTAMAASIWGKAKAITYTIAGIAGLLVTSFNRLEYYPDWMPLFGTVTYILFALAAISSALSFLTYFASARKVLKGS